MGISQRKMQVEGDIYGYLIGISYRDIMRYKGTYPHGPHVSKVQIPRTSWSFWCVKPCLKKKPGGSNKTRSSNTIQLAQKQLATLASGCSDRRGKWWWFAGFKVRFLGHQQVTNGSPKAMVLKPESQWSLSQIRKNPLIWPNADWQYGSSGSIQSLRMAHL